MSVADALILMLIFGGFILSLIALIITIVVAILDNQKTVTKLLTSLTVLIDCLNECRPSSTALSGGVLVLAPFCVFIIACSIKASQRCQFQILDNNKTVTKPFDEVLVTVFLGSAVWGQRPSLYLHSFLSRLIIQSTNH